MDVDAVQPAVAAESRPSQRRIPPDNERRRTLSNSVPESLQRFAAPQTEASSFRHLNCVAINASDVDVDSKPTKVNG